MKIERTKNASRNILFGVLLKAYQIFVPFFMRTAMIYFMGVQYLGLNSLFTSVLHVLNLAELGVGSAMVYSMYKPISEDDENKICALMQLYKKYYRIIGLVVAVIGIILLPFIPKLIKGEVPSNINIYVLYILNLAATVLSYWLFAYKNSLLQAHQRTDVTSKITLITNTIQYGLQLFIIACFHNYYWYLIVALATQALTNIVTAVVVTKMFPRYKAVGNIDSAEIKDINQRIKDLFTSKLGTVIVNSADTIVISAFLGLSMLAVYQNYYFILTSVLGFVTIIFNSCTAGIGNSLIVETQEKNFNDLKKFTFMICWISCFCATCFLCLFQPFMRIWMHGNEDLLLDFSVVVCLSIYYFIYEINQLLNTYKDAGGMWHQDRFRPLVTALTNLGMNLIMVQYWGIYGVILSTVLSMVCVGMPWLFHNLFHHLFEVKFFKEYFRKLMFYVLVSIISCVIGVFICSFINFGDIVTLIVRMIICCIIPNVIFIIVYHNCEEFYQSLIIVNKMTKGKIKLLKKFIK